MRNKRAGATLVAALAIATCVAASPPDSAVIVNSGSTNSYGYTIKVWSDGKGSVTTEEARGGTPSAPKSFTVPSATVTKFFADLAAARKNNVSTVPCMKSASFGTSMHVTWQGWTSPDLSCPSKGPEGDALVSDIQAIREASGVKEFPLRGSGGPIVEPSPPGSHP
jgi:hypothetical protein